MADNLVSNAGNNSSEAVKAATDELSGLENFVNTLATNAGNDSGTIDTSKSEIAKSIADKLGLGNDVTLDAAGMLKIRLAMSKAEQATGIMAKLGEEGNKITQAQVQNTERAQ
jgi:hypothetical protein